MESGAPQTGRALHRRNVAAVIPAYHEEVHVRAVAERICAQLDHVVVVDDGSSDATAARARQGGAEVIVHPENRGKGDAIKSGLRHWLACPEIEFILLLDADGQHLPEEIGLFFAAAAASDAGLFVGTRMNDVREMPFVRRAVNRYMSDRISRLCGQKVPDT
ncbi:MAG: glycosyltransferase family 2 protein, partial [Chthoniobacterales bacterium]|nr:glycosyltransferase family 2 protein [Chthoniobacterales bacterium]